MGNGQGMEAGLPGRTRRETKWSGVAGRKKMASQSDAIFYSATARFLPEAKMTPEENSANQVYSVQG